MSTTPPLPDIEVSEEGYTSRKFGMNRFQKVNQELEEKVRILEEKCNSKSKELEELKVMHNKIISEKSQETILSDTKTRDTQVHLEEYIVELKRNQVENHVLHGTVESLDVQVTQLSEQLNSKIQELEVKNRDLGDLTTKFSQMKDKYNQLEELYNNKVSLNSSADTTIAELSNQLTIKNSQIERNRQESLELKKSTEEYREQNSSYRRYLDDKDKFITTLNARIDDLTFQIEHGLIKKPSVQESTRSMGTPRVVTVSEPVHLSVKSAPRVSNKASRAVPSARRV